MVLEYLQRITQVAILVTIFGAQVQGARQDTSAPDRNRLLAAGLSPKP